MKGLEKYRIKLTKNGILQNSWLDRNSPNNKFRLVEGDTISDGKLQIFYNEKWRFVCSNHFK
jgi:hypothetical protein